MESTALRQLASCFTSMKKLTEHGEPKKKQEGLGEWWIVSPEKAACNRPPGSMRGVLFCFVLLETGPHSIYQANFEFPAILLL